MIFLVAAVCLVQMSLGADWGYFPSNGPSTWADHYRDCGGSSQSPINIVSCDATWRPWCPLWFNFQWMQSDSYTVKNNGHSVVLEFSNEDVFVSTCDWMQYRAVQLHFHWGDGHSDHHGSEHTLDGHAYPLEMHIVTYNSRYPDISAAVDKPHGLAVLGFFFEISEDDNHVLEPIVNTFSSVKHPGESTTLRHLVIFDLIRDAVRRGSYYQYDGSLTTPACYESVNWNVMRTPLHLSQNQMNKFLNLEWHGEDGHGDVSMTNNFRPVQPLNGRQVKSSPARAYFK